MSQLQNGSPQSQYPYRPETLDDLRETFIQNVNHELRSPLSVASGYVELLREGQFGALAPEQQKAMFVIADRIGKLRTIVERVGVVLEAQARAGFSTPLSLNGLVAELVREKRDAAVQAGLTLEAHLDPDAPFISGDPRQLSHALDCLLENALKFTPAGGRVEVQVHTEPGWVCCTVSDSGIGIGEDKLAKVLGGFRQADGSTTRSYGGIGLGLAVVRAVVEAHAGQIEAKSKPSHGSQFTLRLPIPAQEHCMDLPSAAQGIPVRKLRILVVDDEATVRLTLRSGLNKLLNCAVVAANSGEAALQLFKEQPFDLLITDYKMPGMDGVTLSRRIRELYPQTAIVMMTAFGDQVREQAVQVSIQRVLDKPVGLAQVHLAALEVLDQPGG